jgi:hypothetical protein
VNSIDRKEIWDRLSDEEKNNIEEERLHIIDWAIQEEEKAMSKIKLEGRYHRGLDGNYPEIKEISDKVKGKMYNLLKKYGIA